MFGTNKANFKMTSSAALENGCLHSWEGGFNSIVLLVSWQLWKEHNGRTPTMFLPHFDRCDYRCWKSLTSGSCWLRSGCWIPSRSYSAVEPCLFYNLQWPWWAFVDLGSLGSSPRGLNSWFVCMFYFFLMKYMWRRVLEKKMYYTGSCSFFFPNRGISISIRWPTEIQRER